MDGSVIESQQSRPEKSKRSLDQSEEKRASAANKSAIMSALDRLSQKHQSASEEQPSVSTTRSKNILEQKENERKRIAWRK